MMREAPDPRHSLPAMSPTQYLGRKALRHYRVFLAALAAGLAISVLVVRQTKQVYRSESVILYRQVGRPGNTEGDSGKRVATRLQDMLLGRDRLYRVIQELHLYPTVKNRDEAADELRKKIGFRAREGSTFQISFDADSPALAQAVTARLASTLIDDNMRLRVREAEETRRFLDQERARLGIEVKSKEAALGNFLQQHPELALARGGGGGGADPEAEELEREINRIRQANGAPPLDRPDADKIAAVKRAETDYDQAQRDLADKQQRLTDAHPDLIAARQRATQAEGNLRRLREGAGLTRPPETAKSDPTLGLERQLAALRRRSRADGPRVTRQTLQTEVALESLRHDLEQARERLAGLEDKQFQAALVEKLETSGEIGQLVVLDPASRPGLPFTDVRKKVALGGFVLAFALAIGAALLRARADDRIFDRADVEWTGGKPVLTVIPLPSRPRRSADV
jgi:polysaccharide biosynthesis transport protein